MAGLVPTLDTNLHLRLVHIRLGCVSTSLLKRCLFLPLTLEAMLFLLLLSWKVNLPLTLEVKSFLILLSQKVVALPLTSEGKFILPHTTLKGKSFLFYIKK